MSCLYVYDCGDRKLRIAQAFPLTVGGAAECVCHINMPPVSMGVFMERGGNCMFYPRGECRINGEVCTSPYTLAPNVCCIVSHSGGIMVALYSPAGAIPQIQNLISGCNGHSWFIYDQSRGSWQGPIALADACGKAAQLTADAWVLMEGQNACMCHGDEVLALARHLFPTAAAPVVSAGAAPSAAAAQSEGTSAQEDMPDIDEEHGDYTCPVCWLHFNAEDVMSISSHPDLMGDPVLGRDSMKRFFATRFNARGQALDEKGVPCQDSACPHCRRKLPPNFLQMEDFIFSIIGAPSAGKSYYLASLVHALEYTMPNDFELSWRDADPTGNSMLNDVMFRLFNAASPETAYLSKTDLEGALYEEFYRHGRMAKLPKPFIYNLSDVANRRSAVSLVFYDNAGEHFEPGRNSEDSPGAQHVAVASGLFFLFDPTTCRPFRKLIHQTEDPQLEQDGLGVKLDQQGVIMSETGVRIASILNLSTGERVSTPLAVMMGKCDLWENSLDEPLEPIIEDGHLITERVDANSARLRRLLMNVFPSLCSAAESISDTVRYFAVSPLGCSPVRFTDPVTGASKIGPIPQMIAPRHIADPTLWVLSRLAPDLIPSR